ncbi:mitochondrial import inner membrane translocase subunit Tim21 [Nilaparvata lugens]|uniref:mitochondrial import inner membrane translocase subunit Tim21 n=1 Tax=Nilaparvata lugens TaxID=108931 RepID=UPI00193CDBD6|nr:mitochondrial import inner membrane translocase subunit Tim21 [Nilaparvata lugens]
MVKLLPLACRKAFMESVLLFPRGVLAVIRPPSDCMPVRHSSSSNQNQSEAQTSVVSKPSRCQVQAVFVKVKETTKTVTYLGVILAGVGLTGLIFKTVIKGLFSKKSPNNIYSLVLERCRNDPRLQYELGSPITGYGEETRRERRRHVSHVIYEKDGVEHLRMKFYIEGLHKKATVHLEMIEDGNGEYFFRYLFVELDDFGRTAIVLEDNRYGHVDTPKGKRIQDIGFSKELEDGVI